MSVKRKYALIRVATGDYLLPGNDAATLWRIARYTDGPSSGLEIPRDREFWGAWKFRKPLARAIWDERAIDDWDLWSHEGAHFATRAEAIEYALGQATP